MLKSVRIKGSGTTWGNSITPWLRCQHLNILKPDPVTKLYTSFLSMTAHRLIWIAYNKHFNLQFVNVRSVWYPDEVKLHTEGCKAWQGIWEPLLSASCKNKETSQVRWRFTGSLICASAPSQISVFKRTLHGVFINRSFIQPGNLPAKYTLHSAGGCQELTKATWCANLYETSRKSGWCHTNSRDN